MARGYPSPYRDSNSRTTRVPTARRQGDAFGVLTNIIIILKDPIYEAPLVVKIERTAFNPVMFVVAQAIELHIL